MSLQPGQISSVIKTENGFIILKVFSKEPSGQRELTDPKVQQTIREQLWEGAWAVRPAIDASRGAAHEDVAVEASVAALESAVVGPVVEQFHRGTLLHTCA